MCRVEMGVPIRRMSTMLRDTLLTTCHTALSRLPLSPLSLPSTSRHPERPQFEWHTTEQKTGGDVINHAPHAIRSMQ